MSSKRFRRINSAAARRKPQNRLDLHNPTNSVPADNTTTFLPNELGEANADIAVDATDFIETILCHGSS
jgi:hypothetical protein